MSERERRPVKAGHGALCPFGVAHTSGLDDAGALVEHLRKCDDYDEREPSRSGYVPCEGSGMVPDDPYRVPKAVEEVLRAEGWDGESEVPPPLEQVQLDFDAAA